MCFSLAAFNPAGVQVRIEDPKCVAKTFPDYFETLFTVVQTPTPRIPAICVDGPTASGKGTLASEVARKLVARPIVQPALTSSLAIVVSSQRPSTPVQHAAIALIEELLPRMAP